MAVEWVGPHPAAPAATNGVDFIWVDPRLNQVERRCVLTHELVHLEHEHLGWQPPTVEISVRQEAARRLIAREESTAALPWTRDCDELADELWVIHMVLADRFAGLSHHERTLLQQLELLSTTPDLPAHTSR